MDQFSRTVLPAAAEAGIASVTLVRHMATFRRHIERDDSVVLVTQCYRPEISFGSNYLLLLTKRRLIVTRQSRLSGKVWLHFSTPLADLKDVVWRTNNRQSAVEFAATTGDSRHRFFIGRGRSRQLWRVDAQFDRLFRPIPVTA
jgi:hypothetical protein